MASMATAQGNSEAPSNHKNVEDKIKSNINSEETETVETSKFNVTNNQIDGKSQGEVSKEIPLPSGCVLASSRENDEAYNMNHKIRGHCIVFNHRVFDGITNLSERTGTNRDRDNVCVLFRGLGFKVEVYNDLSVKRVKRILENYAYRVDHSNCDCFVVVFMSHGEDGHLYGRDNIFKSEDLYSDFTADNCTSLAGKPKMFFIQACRGEELDSGVKMLNKSLPDETDSGFISLYKIPNHVDFLICWSTVPGHYSWRNTTNGSWFIQSLVEVFGRDANSLDILSMMTCVNRYMVLNFESNPSSESMHGKKQSACIVSTLMRLVYLKPKQRSLTPPHTSTISLSILSSEAASEEPIGNSEHLKMTLQESRVVAGDRTGLIKIRGSQSVFWKKNRLIKKEHTSERGEQREVSLRRWWGYWKTMKSCCGRRRTKTSEWN